MDDDDYIKEFWTRYGESEGFDVEHLIDIKPPRTLLYSRKFEDNDYYPTQIALYARFGIHRYNMIQGKNLQLSCIEKYIGRPSTVCNAYYITLVAKDPDAGNSLLTFQTKVVDEGFDIMQLTCSIARPKYGPRDNSDGPLDDCYQVRLPDEWPLENAFNDKKRYYVMKKSDLRKHDWVRLYLELAFFNANTKLKNRNPSNLVILKVAVETEENVKPPNERLNARTAVFYIRYRYYPNKGRAPKSNGHKPPRDRVAIIKRTMDKNTGYLTIEFDGRFSKTLLLVND